MMLFMTYLVSNSKRFSFAAGVRIEVTQGKDYLLRLVNTALINNYFFTIANHTVTVVAMDGEYVKPYTTSVVTILPGQSMDVFLSCNSAIGEDVLPNPGLLDSTPINFDCIS
jgi:laccase